MNNRSKTFWAPTEKEREILENVEMLADIYCENKEVDAKEIHQFIDYVYNTYGYINLLKEK